MDERACLFLLEFSLSLLNFGLLPFRIRRRVSYCGDSRSHKPKAFRCCALATMVRLRLCFTLPGVARTMQYACWVTAGAAVWSSDRDIGRRRAWCRASRTG